MYRYNELDQRLVKERVEQYRGQVQRYLSGQLSEDIFRELRLRNGLYIQRHGPMLRIAIPYGQLSSVQLHRLADISDEYDQGIGHISTRQNMQMNWVKLEDTPDILESLSEVEMHAIQTSGNCIRNITVDPFAGVSPTEIEDPRPWAEIIRQWSTFHPEFNFLPRKFKISVSGGADDAACALMHDIGLRMTKNEAGEIGFVVYVGGGLGRTPIIGKLLHDFIAWQDILGYLEAVLRVYNLHGRRDNMYKARIKILVKALGIDAFREEVSNRWKGIQGGPITLTPEERDRVKSHFQPPLYQDHIADSDTFLEAMAANEDFSRWVKSNVRLHKHSTYRSVWISLKKTGQPPGDIDSSQMRLVASLSDGYGFGEIRVSQNQNLLLPDIAKKDLFTVWKKLESLGLATPNMGSVSDIVCCPGGDLCSLANARSIPVATALQQKFSDQKLSENIGDMRLNISGCMNACGHHHIGDIGILGVDKQDREFYQVTLGGQWGEDAHIGEVLGPSVSKSEVPELVEKVIQVYLKNRQDGERFNTAYRRLGKDIFKEAVYGKSLDKKGVQS